MAIDIELPFIALLLITSNTINASSFLVMETNLQNKLLSEKQQVAECTIPAIEKKAEYKHAHMHSAQPYEIITREGDIDQNTASRSLIYGRLL